MSHPAYYGRPAIVAGYRRPSAPPSVHIVALFQYLGGLLTLLAAAGIALLALGGRRAFDEHRIRIPDQVLQGLTGLGLVIAVGLTVIALVWLLVARKLQTGRQWARVTVLVLSLLSIASTGYDVWRFGDRQLLGGLVLPVLYVLLLNTRAARSWFRWGRW